MAAGKPETSSSSASTAATTPSCPSTQGELKATSLQPVAEMAIQAAIQADAYLTAGGTTEQPEKQSIDMVLLTPENACGYYQFAPVAEGETSPDCE